MRPAPTASQKKDGLNSECGISAAVKKSPFLIQDVIEEEIRNLMRRWVKNPKRLLKETLLHQVFLGVLLQDAIEILFFPEQVPGLAIDVNNAGFVGGH